MLIAAALIVIYIVLGVLYESLVHPVTVLSTLPSAGVGAVLALLLFRMDFTLIALIGVFLLIGIVKKNAILIIDFALEAERARGLTPFDAVREACLLRFRPILMTTLAAALGALPLAIGFGEGAELRRPLGVAIIGGLIASQLLTLLTTPVVYLLLDKLRRRGADERHLSHGDAASQRYRHDGRRMSARRRGRRCRCSRRRWRLLSACTVGPAYQRPGRPVPRRSRKRRRPAIRRGSRRTRRCARPRAVVGAVRRPGAVVARGQVEVANQNVAGRGRVVRAGAGARQPAAGRIVPVVGGSTRARRATAARARWQAAATCALGFTASWEPDIWGAVAPAR